MPSLTNTRAERALRVRIRGSLTEWAVHALAPQGQVPAAHHRVMIDALTAVADGECDRLMLLLPPGSAKSTYASLLFPPWFLAREPGSEVIAVSHTAALAEGFGRGVRDLIREHGPRLGVRLSRASRAAGRFGVVGGGGYFATGVQGAVTGRRADLLLIDDPVRSQAEAESAVMRSRVWAWYRSDLMTRLRPGGRIVLVMTRWHPDDLGGRLLAGGESWRVIRLPALAEAGCDLLGRAEGEALWPAWEDAAALRRKRLALGDRAFEALFQQNPRVGGASLFRVSQIPVGDCLLPGRAVRAWDLAASMAGDWTVGVLLVGGEGVFQVADVVRFRGGPEVVVSGILETAAKDGRRVTIGLPQDPGQAGRAQVAFLTGRLAGFRVVSGQESGAKAVRAMPVASQINAGNLSLLRGGWNGAFLEELADFPGGAKDDQVDALSRAFGVLTEVPGRARVGSIGWSTR